MSRKTMMAIEHSTPMPQRSESGVSARYETKVFSFWDGEAWGEAHAFTYEIAWIPERHCCGVSKPFVGAILLERVRVALQS
jgi:hypothetical protein